MMNFNIYMNCSPETLREMGINPASFLAPPPVPEGWRELVHPVLVRCIGSLFNGHDLSRPFVVDEYVYTSNGSIIARMPVPEGWPVTRGLSALAESVLGMFDRGRWRKGPIQLPEVWGEDGGYCRCRMDAWPADLPISCDLCLGTGVANPKDSIMVARRYRMSRQYIAFMHEFEMSTYLPIPLDPSSPVRFGIGDVTGLVMPTRTGRGGAARRMTTREMGR